MKELECSQDFSHYKSMGIFPDAQGQLTPQSLVRSGRISNSSEMLCMFFLPASMKKIRSKMKALECSQHFPHYNSMGAIRCHGHQSSDPIWPKTYCSLSPTPMLVQIISLRLAHWLRRYSSLKMFTDTQTHRRRLDWYTIMHQSFVSTAPSGPGISGAFNFSIFKAPLKALHSGA